MSDVIGARELGVLDEPKARSLWEIMCDGLREHLTAEEMMDE